ncbi:MAG: multifunctional 2-oxoglutarate metabolism enzyme, partial [Actinomycetota bacterium]|nr:multifunctional 2-oxoglutarate metabolism enzyme [Actinomycetota bacterium]
MDNKIEPEAFGPNSWLVDEMYQQYQENPLSVGESWRDFFEGYTPSKPSRSSSNGQEPPRAEARPLEETLRAIPAPSPAAAAPSQEPQQEAPEGSSPLRGVAARIAENMEASLSVPTATSVRTIPAKLLEENRRIINRYLASKRGGKVSFTHLIGYAVLRALEARPSMKAS